MAQSIIAGSTNYGEQSIKEIRKDIVMWSEYANKIKMLFSETISDLKKTNYWRKIPSDFASFCESVPMICDSFINDFNIIIEAIDGDKITKREIKLMENICKTSYENEEYSWKSYKNPDNGYWHDYGNTQFEKVEKLYAKGRDFFVTLKDVGNACRRMNDYVIDAVNTTTYLEDNSININGKNHISNTLIGNKNVVGERKESFFKKYIWPICATIIAGIIVAVICYYLNIK